MKNGSAPRSGAPWEEANNSHTAPRCERSWALIEANWRVSPLSRVRKCRRFRQSGVGAVTIETRRGGNDASYSGLQTCGSVWACPACAGRIAAERGETLQAAIAAHVELGGDVVHLTATLRHRDGQALAPLLNAIAPAWDYCRRGTAGRRLQTMNFAGFVRVVEITHGANGWHPHVHALMLFDGLVTDEEVRDLQSAMGSAWRSSVVKSGLDAPSDEHGLQAKRVDMNEAIDAVSGYLTKASATPEAVSREITGSGEKEGRNGSRTPFRILGDIVDLGDYDDVELWQEYCTATKGRQQITSTRGLIRRLANVIERTDEEIAQSSDGLGRPVATLTPVQWDAICTVRGRPGELLRATQGDPRTAFSRVETCLDAWGLGPPGPPPVGDRD